MPFNLLVFCCSKKRLVHIFTRAPPLEWPRYDGSKDTFAEVFAAHTEENDDWQRRRRSLLHVARVTEPATTANFSSGGADVALHPAHAEEAIAIANSSLGGSDVTLQPAHAEEAIAMANSSLGGPDVALQPAHTEKMVAISNSSSRGAGVDLQLAHAHEPGVTQSGTSGGTGVDPDEGKVARMEWEGQTVVPTSRHEGGEDGAGADRGRRGAGGGREGVEWADSRLERRVWLGAESGVRDGGGGEGRLPGRGLKYDVDEALEADATGGKRCGNSGA